MIISNFPGGGGTSGANNKLPGFEYTGEYALVEDGAGWKIRFLTSGTLFMKEDRAVDIFAVGGGGSGEGNSYAYVTGGCGGGGGYTTTVRNVQLTAGTYYEIVVGAGGEGNYVKGGSTSFTVSASAEALCTADGGMYGKQNSSLGGDGGSGGGGYSNTNGSYVAGNGGSDGSDGTGPDAGEGQGTTTREFGEATGALYAGGGGTGQGTQCPSIGLGGAGGGGDGGVKNGNGNPGEDNTGGGGGGGCNGTETGGAGGSGIVIIRNTHYAAAS